MNIRMILRLLGTVLQYEGLVMLPAVMVSVIYGEDCWWALLVSAAVLGGLGIIMRRIKQENRRMHVREGFSAVVLIWLCASLGGALPFFISGAIPNYLDALFEAISGLTTTGGSILADVGALPKGLHFWRAQTHWMGGLGILMITIAIMPSLGAGTMYLMRAESSGPTTEKLAPKLKESAKVLYTIYIAMSAALLVVLIALRVPVFDAFIHTFSTAGTGGFSSLDGSIAEMNRPAVEWVLAVFMLLFSVNFAMLHLLILGNFKKVFQNSELRLFLCIILTAWGMVALNVMPVYGGILQALRPALFQVASVMSTTGFASADFTRWPVFSQIILLILMLIGGCAGSTAGGLKVIRVFILGQLIRGEMGSIVHPRMVRTVKYGGRPLEKEIIHNVLIYFTTLILISAVGVLAVSLEGHDLASSASAVWTCINNTGPGLGQVGATGNFSFFSPITKLVLMLLMLLGRLEIFPVLLLFTRSFWRKA